MQFQFKSTKKSFEVRSVAGEVIKTYYVDIGNRDTLKNVLNRFAQLQTDLKEIESGVMSPEAIDTIVLSMQNIIDTLLRDWETLWRECEENVFAMLELVKALVDLCVEAMNERDV